MSFWTILGKALGLVPAVAKAVETIADAARKKDVPRDIRRQHFWIYTDKPIRCVYCNAQQTKLNVIDWCPHFEVRS